VRCVACGHVYNRSFDYAEVPYSEKPNLMFNRGSVWSSFITDLQKKLLSRLKQSPVVVEIGHGDGSFLASLSRINQSGQYIGFDPHGAVAESSDIKLRAELFDPSVHLQELSPDLLVIRHVLEHLNNPLGFLQAMSFAATVCEMSPLAYFEVPCIDNVFETMRTVDFYYEHSSQFSTESFSRMLELAGVEVIEIGHGYNREVVFGLVRLAQQAETRKKYEESNLFFEAAKASLITIHEQLQRLIESGKRVGVWGGTGKSAAFMCRYGLDRERFPVVVDSDPEKAGTYVPGTGQEIRYRDYLLEYPVDVLIIPPQWRAQDILLEMDAAGIEVERVLIEHNSQLVDFSDAAQIYSGAD